MSNRVFAPVPDPVISSWSLRAITVFEGMINIHIALEDASLQFVGSLTQLNNSIRLSFGQLQLDVSVILPFPAPSAPVIIPEYVGFDHSHHTLNQITPHIVNLLHIMSCRKIHTSDLVAYCHKCLNVLNNNIRQYFEGLSIDTSDFRNVPPIPFPSVDVFDYNDVGFVRDRRNPVRKIPTINRTSINIVRWAADHLVFYQQNCLPVLISNINRGRELLMARASESAGPSDSNVRQGFMRRLEINDAESGPPSLNPPPNVSNSNTQEGHDSDDSISI